MISLPAIEAGWGPGVRGGLGSRERSREPALDFFAVICRLRAVPLPLFSELFRDVLGVLPGIVNKSDILFATWWCGVRSGALCNVLRRSWRQALDRSLQFESAAAAATLDARRLPRRGSRENEAKAHGAACGAGEPSLSLHVLSWATTM